MINLSSISHFLNLLKFEKIIKINVLDRIHDKLINCVKLYSILELAKSKFPYYNLKKSFFIIYGTIKSMNLTIVR